MELPETFKMSDIPEDMLEEGYSSYVTELIRSKLGAKYIPKVFDGQTPHEALQKQLKYQNKRWNKKRKHPYDKRLNLRNNTYHCTCERCQMGKQHKHLRAQKVYLEEEYFEDIHIDVDEGYWGIYDVELGCHVVEDDWRFEPCGMFPTEDDYLEEMGCEHLCSDYWKEYVDHTGKVLDKYELMSKESEKEDQAYWDDKFFEEWQVGY